MTRTASASSTFVNLTSALALVVAVGGGGAYAATVAKNSVGSAQVKNGAIKAQDVKVGSLTGVQVADGSVTGSDLKDGSVTGADVDEASLRLPATPLVFEGPYTHQATLSGTWTEHARVSFTLPADGLVRLEAEATLGANPAATPGGGYVQTLFYIDDDGQVPFKEVGAYTLWGSPGPGTMLVQHPTASDVHTLKAGTYVVSLHLRELGTGGHFSTLQNGQIDVMYFPAGAADPDVANP
ncbi:hypothetical protein [Nocardioides sp.]|uniref:hypothetical protein n=1 Tax=Nocardioides sp. TaxID=35761 RepID=UPI001A2849A0|nr:hypothetical protein [Nocardioides sp.]MBJ7359498.1 hypothetical protein [Nocardioides sp.]